MKTITLIGMMGSGKTTVGKVLAQKLNLPHIDVDSYIENKEGKTISEIFAQNSEEYFRKLEAQTIKEIFDTPKVISTGGGAFENQQTRELLLENSLVIYLKTSSVTVFERIKNNNERPLLNNNMTVEKIREITEKRQKNYELAHITVLTDNKNPKEIVDEISGAL